MKRGFEVKKLDVHYADSLKETTVAYVNSTSLEIFNSCPRKAYYSIVRNARRDDEKDALSFGSAIHEGLRAYYALTPASRSAAVAVAAFRIAGASLKDLPADDKRSFTRGVQILEHYVRTYQNDPWLVYSDSRGPLVERDFEFELVRHGNLIIKLFGTIDAVFEHSETKERILVDHKTTSSLGKDFYGRTNPNHQFTGYLLACKEAFGINTDTAMMNGIQVAKTQFGLARAFTNRTQSDYDEYKEMVLYRVSEHLARLETGVFPMAGYPTCVNFGGCQFKEVCESHASQRENVLQSIYPNVTPVTR